MNNDSKMSLSGLVNGIQLRIAYALAAQVEMDGGCDDQREHHGDEDAADHGDGKGLQHLGTGAEVGMPSPYDDFTEKAYPQQSEQAFATFREYVDRG